MADNTYTRTVRIPVATPTATKAGKLNRAMKDYRRARQLAIEYFDGEGDALDFSYSEQENLRKRISAHESVDLLARAVYPAIKVAEQAYAEYEKGEFDSPPTAKRADILALESQITHIFHNDGRYYLNVATGRGSVNLPLRTSDDAWHTSRLPKPDAAPPEGKRRIGVEFYDLDAEDFPSNTVQLSTSTLKRTGRRSFVANLVFQHERRISRSGESPQYIIGVDRGRNELAYAALYDRQRDHVVDWANRSGDEVEHYMQRFAKRVREFQQANVWERMEDARVRRFRYKKQVDFEVANMIVDLARSNLSVAIALEQLSSMNNLGRFAEESRRFDEWSYGRLRDAIAQKAEPHDIPVVAVKPHYTSQLCSRCGSDDCRRSGVHFECQDCGYEQHADANAAVNIAKRAADGYTEEGNTSLEVVA